MLALKTLDIQSFAHDMRHATFTHAPVGICPVPRVTIFRMYQIIRGGLTPQAMFDCTGFGMSSSVGALVYE
jgi:hypothetical protein